MHDRTGEVSALEPWQSELASLVIICDLGRRS
jgi:hypothetical protein